MWYSQKTQHDCFICFYSKGVHYFENLHGYVCGDKKCLDKFYELDAVNLQQYRVSTAFRGSLDCFRRSTAEDFELRNRLLNVLLAGKTNRKQLAELVDFGIKTMGQCIGGKPRKFSVSNITNDVLNIHKELLKNPDLIQKKISCGQIFKITDLAFYNDDDCSVKSIFM